MALKLHLTLLWLAGGGREAPGTESHETSVHSYMAYYDELAALIGLCTDQVSELGDESLRRARDRVATAVRTLRANHLVKAESRAGRHEFTLLHDSAEAVARGGEMYFAPKGTDDHYVRLPPEFWVHGWMAALSGRAIWALLALLERGADREARFISNSHLEAEYRVSRKTYEGGCTDLCGAGLATRFRRPVRTPEGLGSPRRRRYVYLISLEAVRKHGP